MDSEQDQSRLTTTITTTTTTTTTITRSRQASPNPDTVSDSGYSEQTTTNATPSPSAQPQVPPPSTQPQAPQQRLPGPDKAIPPSAIHPAFRSDPQYSNPTQPSYAGASMADDTDTLSTIRESRESRAMSDKMHFSQPRPQQGRAEPAAPTSVLGNLKAAGEGLTGVRDSLKSTYSTEKDRYSSRKPSARDLKNQGSAPQIRNAPPRPDWGPSQEYAPTGDHGRRSHEQHQPLNYASSNSTLGQGSDSDRSRRKSLGQVPASFSPESTGTSQRDHVGALKRLVKGKP